MNNTQPALLCGSGLERYSDNSSATAWCPVRFQCPSFLKVTTSPVLLVAGEEARQQVNGLDVQVRG